MLFTSFVPQTIPQSQEKKQYLEAQKIPFVYLGQGLIFTPPKSAEKEYNEYLITQNISPEEFPLSVLWGGKNTEGGVYSSPRLEEIFPSILKQSSNEAFGSFQYSISQNTIAELFCIPENKIATFQCDNLMMALETCFLSLFQTEQKPVTHIFLPEKYRYSGYIDFVEKLKGLGQELEIISIPEVQSDGSQDIQKIEEIFHSVSQKNKLKNGLGVFIDQESNNNASGYDRNENLNDSLVNIFKKYPIIYFGDIAYKGLKESLLEPYPLVQKFEKENISAYFYCSFTKITNYRSSPSFKNILFYFSGEKDVFGAFKKVSRSMGIGTSSLGSVLMNTLIRDKKFQKEVEILRLYLSFIRNAVLNDVFGTELEPYFSSATSGIFRSFPFEIAQKLNQGSIQAITVGKRINIWPLGDPLLRKIFLDAYYS